MENIDSIPIMITLKEASQRTGLSYDCLRKLCLARKIVHLRAGNRYFVNFARLLDYLETATGTDDKQTEAR